jgi:hypothetical protein
MKSAIPPMCPVREGGDGLIDEIMGLIDAKCHFVGLVAT